MADLLDLERLLNELLAVNGNGAPKGAGTTIDTTAPDEGGGRRECT